MTRPASSASAAEYGSPRYRTAAIFLSSPRNLVCSRDRPLLIGSRPAFIAAKNAIFPNQAEIDSLELYISKYLWGWMQMTDREKYPYAIYGIQNWKANRASPDEASRLRASADHLRKQADAIRGVADNVEPTLVHDK